ncbi:MAG: hypothetical protein CK532_05560 [Flavobacteriales bacterium]|nr:MAG: hypothetical protein CK532_05560 [Flavobacteriales bacterium]
MKPIFNAISFFILLSLVCLFPGCKNRESGQYAILKIDSVSIITKTGQGNAIHQILGVQVYINNQMIGNFELPVKIPVLVTREKVKLDILPMVFINGSKNAIVHLNTLKSFGDSVVFSSSKTHVLNPTFTYRSNAEFPWVEDFEDGRSKLVAISPSPFPGDSLFIEKRPFDLNGKFVGTSTIYCVRFENTDTAKYIDIGSFDAFQNLPTDGRNMFFEFDIKTDLPVQLALSRKNTITTELIPYLLVNPTRGQWKRFYVNLVYEIAGQPSGTSLRIFFDINKPASVIPNREILFDNLRLSYLK